MNVLLLNKGPGTGIPAVIFASLMDDTIKLTANASIRSKKFCILLPCGASIFIPGVPASLKLLLCD